MSKRNKPRPSLPPSSSPPPTQSEEGRAPQPQPDVAPPTDTGPVLPPPAAGASDTGSVPCAAKLGSQIKADICRISPFCKPDLRGLLDSYLRFVSPSFAGRGDAPFPRTVRRAVRDRHASQTRGWGNCLCFHVGDAVLAYHNLVLREANGAGNPETDDPPPDHDYAVIQFLHEIAEIGPGQFYMTGNDADGFRLLTRDEDTARREARGG